MYTLTIATAAAILAYTASAAPLDTVAARDALVINNSDAPAGCHWVTIPPKCSINGLLCSNAIGRRLECGGPASSSSASGATPSSSSTATAGASIPTGTALVGHPLENRDAEAYNIAIPPQKQPAASGIAPQKQPNPNLRVPIDNGPNGVVTNGPAGCSSPLAAGQCGDASAKPLVSLENRDAEAQDSGIGQSGAGSHPPEKRRIPSALYDDLDAPAVAHKPANAHYEKREPFRLAAGESPLPTWTLGGGRPLPMLQEKAPAGGESTGTPVEQRDAYRLLPGETPVHMPTFGGRLQPMMREKTTAGDDSTGTPVEQRDAFVLPPGATPMQMPNFGGRFRPQMLAKFPAVGSDDQAGTPVAQRDASPEADPFVLAPGATPIHMPDFGGRFHPVMLAKTAGGNDESTGTPVAQRDASPAADPYVLLPGETPIHMPTFGGRFRPQILAKTAAGSDDQAGTPVAQRDASPAADPFVLLPGETPIHMPDFGRVHPMALAATGNGGESAGSPVAQRDAEAEAANDLFTLPPTATPIRMPVLSGRLHPETADMGAAQGHN